MNLVYLVYIPKRAAYFEDAHPVLSFVFRIDELSKLRSLLDANALLRKSGMQTDTIYFDIFDTDAQQFVAQGLAVLEEAE